LLGRNGSLTDEPDETLGSGVRGKESQVSDIDAIAARGTVALTGSVAGLYWCLNFPDMTT
jgi:hypothetical protein